MEDRAQIRGSLCWELVDTIVADPEGQDTDKRNNIQLHVEFPSPLKYREGRDKNSQYSYLCRYLVELAPRQLGPPVSDPAQS